MKSNYQIRREIRGQIRVLICNYLDARKNEKAHGNAASGYFYCGCGTAYLIAAHRLGSILVNDKP